MANDDYFQWCVRMFLRSAMHWNRHHTTKFPTDSIIWC